MDPSALESVSHNFQSCLDWWGWFILISTAVVAGGLILEYWEPVREFIEELRRPAAVFRWLKFWELTGAILVTVGVFGEFWGAYEASRVETELRENNHKIENLLENEATANKDEATRLAEQVKKEIEARTKIEESVQWRSSQTNCRRAGPT